MVKHAAATFGTNSFVGVPDTSFLKAFVLECSVPNVSQHVYADKII